MAPNSITFRRSAARGWGLVKAGLFPMAMAVFLNAMGFGGKDGKLWEFFPLAVFSGLGLLLVGIGVFMLADRAPKLSADGAGLFNHMTPGGGRQIPWGAIQSLDCSVDPFDRTGNLGRLIVYHRTEGGGVAAEAIDLTGLEGGPLVVFTEVKRRWLQATTEPGSGGPGAAPRGSPAEPGAAPDRGRM